MPRRRAEQTKIGLMLPTDLMKQLEELAIKDYDTVTAQIRKALILYLKKREEEG